MFEIPYTNEVKYCYGCGFPIAQGKVADPKSDRENPNYFHIGCYAHKERKEREQKQVQ